MTKRNPTRQLIKATKSARDAEYDYARMRSEIKGVSLGHSGERDLSKMRRGVKKRRKRAQRRMAAPLIREARMNTDTGEWRKVGRYLWGYSVGGYDILVIRPGGIPQGEPGNSLNWDNPDYYLIFIIDPMVGYPTFDIAQGTPDPLPKWATHGSDRFAGDRIISTHRLSASEGTFEGGFARSRMKPFGKVKATAMNFLRWTMSHPNSPQKKGDGTRRIASLMSEEAWSASVHDNPAPMVAMAIQQLVMLLVPIILKMGQGKVEKYKRATLQGKIKMLKNWSWALVLGVGPGPLFFMKAPGKRAKRMREALAMGIDNVLKDPQKLEAIQAAGEVGVAGVQAYGARKGKVSPIRKRRRRRIQAKKNGPTRAQPTYPFEQKEKQYIQYTTAQLEHALKDAKETYERFSDWHDEAFPNWYMDDVHTILKELRKRQANWGWRK